MHVYKMVPSEIIPFLTFHISQSLMHLNLFTLKYCNAEFIAAYDKREGES